MSLCSTFRELSQTTWRRIGKMRRVGYDLREDTITDLNLLELKERHSNRLFSRAFSTVKEGKIGADWEWWFVGRNWRAFGFRVQAKIIDPKEDSFDHLHYKDGEQCKDLVEQSLGGYPKQVPLYCLYTHYDIDSLEVDPNPYIQARWCGGLSGSEGYGCSLMSALDVRSLYKKGDRDTSISNLYEYIEPWQCLPCGEVSSDTVSLPNRVFEFWKEVFLPREKELVESGDLDLNDEISELWGQYQEFSPLNEPPEYVRDIIDEERGVSVHNPNISDSTGRVTVFLEKEI